ncbi:hypothetical protein CYLTODRAFT_493863 [Cylindrobasidium torrendii FP15055 ss-10]|uniref:F-box domain-containing protein n=1 Tax=Cylindrobasidium torrendii FP15055 ss-10 TaxID=1314674 RepID=A0A0D7AZ43_9AGAR|nr:hypothetical protein CYLTODRAFT_493863 [Cylindrobasidium torrendii FP15055 ss-10]
MTFFRTTTLESLPDDVLQNILEQCPDFKTHSTATLVCKRLHRITEHHPKSIAKAIATRLIGEALPQAIRVARYRKMMLDSGVYTFNDREEPIPAEVDMNAVLETDEEGILTIEEKQVITRLAWCLEVLEDAFSWRHRDRKSFTSVLSNSESFKFRKALLRVALYCAIFSPSHLVDVAIRDMYERDPIESLKGVPIQAVDNCDKARRASLASFASQDLLEMLPVVEFLADLGTWMAKLYISPRGLRVTTGPLSIALAFQSHLVSNTFGKASHCHDWISVEGKWGDIDSSAICDVLYRTNNTTSDMFLTNVLLDVLEGRQGVKSPPERTGLHTLRGLDLILNSVDISSEQCVRCKASETLLCDNWAYAGGMEDFDMHRLATHLPGILSKIYSVTYDLFIEHQSLDEAEPYVFRALMLELMDEDSIQAEWEDIYEDDLLCTTCLESFLKAHLHLWLRLKQVSRGDPIREDCLLGYECQKMRSAAHAAEFNHLCPPTENA